MKLIIFKELIIVTIILSLIFLLTDCANIQTPPGGPKDSIPPSVIWGVPLDMTKNFKDKQIEIRFSEWPDRNKVVQNVSISPPVELGYSWSGTKLNIEFLNELKPNTTYSFLLGTEYTDLSGNKPDSAFAITFSTGEKIDSGKINGILLGEKIDGAYIYAYKTNDKNIDTLNPEITPAEYKTQVGNNGNFTLRALPDGNYRLIAVKTDFKDNLFHPATDFFGTTSQDLTVKDGNASLAKIILVKYPDLLNPEIIDFQLAGKKILYFTFSKPLLSNFEVNFDAKAIQIFDSVSGKILPIEGYFLDSTFSQRLFVRLSDTLIPEVQYSFKVLSDNYFKDTSGVFVKKINYNFSSKQIKSEFQFKLISAPFKDSTRAVKPNFNYSFNFNCPVQFDSAQTYFKFSQLNDKSVLPFSVKLISPNSIKLTPDIELLPENWYRIEFMTKNISSIFEEKLKDTIFKYDFQTQDWRTFPKVSGKLLDKFGCSQIILQLISSDKAITYTANLNEDKSFSFPYVKPGKYFLRVFCDENKNGTYDFGQAFPYRHSEFFKNFSNEINVQERWDVENIMLLFDK